MDRYTVESFDQYDMEQDPEGIWVMYEDAQSAIADAVAAERERCATWLRWYDRAETRRSEAISNGDHWAPDLALGPNKS